jgi:hypothetical protein
VGADFNQDILLRQHEHVQVAGLVQGAVHERQKHLVHYVRAVLRGVLAILLAHTYVLVTVQQLKPSLGFHRLQRTLL